MLKLITTLLLAALMLAGCTSGTQQMQQSQQMQQMQQSVLVQAAPVITVPPALLIWCPQLTDGSIASAQSNRVATAGLYDACAAREPGLVPSPAQPDENAL